MLLKRQEKNEVVEALYESSNIVASKYHKGSQTLSITFKTGQEYVYEGVPATEYHTFELAESQGKVFNKYIKQYPFKKGDFVDVVSLKEQLEQAKKEELNQMAENVALTANEVAKEYQESGSLNLIRLESLVRRITTYTEKIKENEKQAG